MSDKWRPGYLIGQVRKRFEGGIPRGSIQRTRRSGGNPAGKFQKGYDKGYDAALDKTEIVMREFGILGPDAKEIVDGIRRKK